jgi:biotin carboxylase
MSVLLLHTTNASRRRHLAAARQHASELGEQLVVLVRRATWEYDYADRVLEVDATDLDAVIAAVRAENAREAVRGVLSLVEHSVPAAAAAAQALGLPGIDPATAWAARDKHAMRTRFAGAELAQPQFAIATTVEEALSVARVLGYPIVAKPVLGGGSKHVRRFDDTATLRDNFEELRRQSWDIAGYDPLAARGRDYYKDGLLLEQYLPGDEISVESVVDDGRTRVVAIHDKPLPMTGPFFEEVASATPTALDTVVQRRVTAATEQAHRALGITTGVTHTEFRVNADGEPFILETGARLGGGPVYASVLRSTGIDLVCAAVDLALGRPCDLPDQIDAQPVGGCLFFAPKPGRITAIHGVDELRNDPRVFELHIYRQVGDDVDVPPLISQAHGHALFTAHDRDTLRQTFDDVAKTLRIEVA